MSEKAAKILVIDDETIIRESMTDYLVDLGYHVLTAENGQVGIEILETGRPDLVLTDLRMPKVDGLEVLGHVRERMPNVPVIVVSGTGNISDSVQALRLGAADYIIKPIKDMTVVLHAIEKTLERVRLAAENQAYQENLESLVASRTRKLEQANSRLAHINSRLQKIVDTAKGISVCSNIREFGATVLSAFASHMMAAGGSIFIREEQGLRLLHTLDPLHVPDFISFPLAEDSAIRRVIESREPVMVEDMEKEQGKIRSSGWDGYLNGSAIVFPLPDDTGDVIGILTLHSKVPPPFIEQDREIGSILASYSCETFRATSSMEALRLSEQRLHEMAEMLPEAVFEADMNFKLTFANRRAFDLFGYTREDFYQGLNGIDMLAPEERQRALEDFSNQQEFDDLETFEYKGMRKDGSFFPILFRLNAITGDGGLVGYRGVIVDITERKKTEEALRKSEEKYRTIFDESPIGIFYFDRSGTILECNKKFVGIIGSSYNLLIGMNMPDQLQDEHMRDCIRQTLQEGSAVYEGQYESVTAKKSTYVRVTFKGIRNQDNALISGIGLVEDISERKLAEEELRCSEQKYRTLFEEASDAIFLLDKKTGRYLDANKAAERITGRSCDELKQLTTREVSPEGAQERLSMISRSVHTAKLGQVTYIRPDGEKRIAALSSVPINNEMAMGIARDITDELAMESQLRQAQKMEAIGTLTGGIAHDFNNILSAIIGYSELILADVTDLDPLHNKIMTIYRAGERARDLVSRILTFSRSEEPVSAAVRMDQIVREAINLLRPAIPTTIEIRHQIESGCHVIGEPTRLQQVVMNLCTNAYHSMERDGGTLDIILRVVEMGEQEAAVYGLPAQAYLKLSIVDSGCGIPKEQIERIFDPYFTTKSQGKGTGLGLSMVLGIVKSHGGAVVVDSKVGMGTRFDVFLPKAQSRDVVIEKSDTRTAGGKENILLVDDEKDITEVQAEMLKRLGYHITVTNNAEEAVTMVTGRPEGYDLIISDMTMPVMTGLQLAEKIKAVKPDARIIICSGYNENTGRAMVRDGQVDGFLQKPVNMRELAKAVRRILDKDSL